MNSNTKQTTKESPSCLVVKTGATCLPAQGTLLTVFLLLVCLSQTGCNICKNARRIIFQEPSEYSWIYDRKESVKVYRAWADRAWLEQCGGDSQACYSNVYALGFKDGFVDMVFAGGSGEPPAVPPREYWNVDMRNPDGHMQATDWFTGYRHGAQLAREEGYRERALIPASLNLFGQRDECSNRPNCQCPSCLAEPAESFDPFGPDSFAPDSPVPDYAVEEQPIPRLTSPRQSEHDVPELELPTNQEALPSPRRTTTQPTPPANVPPATTPRTKPEVLVPDFSPDVDAIFDSSASTQVPPKRQPARRLNFVAAARVRQASAAISLSDQKAKERFQQHSR